jgi:hypothetical protein
LCRLRHLLQRISNKKKRERKNTFNLVNDLIVIVEGR